MNSTERRLKSERARRKIAERRVRALYLTLIEVVMGVAIATLLVIACWVSSPKWDLEHFTVMEYSVSAGDTMWDIGKATIGEKYNIWDWIDYVEVLNGRDLTALAVGDTIKIYVPVER